MSKTGRVEKRDLLKGSLVYYLYSKYKIEDAKPRKKFINVIRSQKRD